MKTDTMTYTIGSAISQADSTTIGRTEQFAAGKNLPDRGIRGTSPQASLRDNDYLAGGLILALLVFIITIGRSKHYFTYKTKDFFTEKRRYTDESIRANSSEAWGILTLTAITCLSVSTLLYKWLVDMGAADTMLGMPYATLGLCFLASAAMVGLKAVLYAAVNWVFFPGSKSRKWLSAYFLLTALASVMLLPITLITAFHNFPLTKVTPLLAGVLILYEILLFYKLRCNFNARKSGLLLIFLYFCAVEVMPALTAWSLIVKYIEISL